MRRIVLHEFATKRGIGLTIGQRDAIRKLHPGIRIEPSSGLADSYDLTSDQRIGLVCVSDLVIEVRPKIPMSSVLYLVSHACSDLKWSEQEPEFAQDLDLVEAVAVILARLVQHATRRGLLNGYQSEEEALPAPRGRVLFDEQLRRRSGRFPPVEVRHDVFTPDVLENRLLLSALLAMGQLPLRSEAAVRQLGRARRLLGGVASVRFPPHGVPDIVFTRLKSHYRAAVSLATLLLRSTSLDLGSGGTRGSAFLIDMNKVFEEFVRTSLREAIGVPVRDFPTPTSALHLDVAGSVSLKTDLRLLRSERVVWVGDAKYKRLPPGAYQNADLYQMLAYSIALGLPGGTLIYAADQGVNAAEHVVAGSGQRLHVVSLDLSAPVPAIEGQIRVIAEGIVAATDAAGTTERPRGDRGAWRSAVPW